MRRYARGAAALTLWILASRLLVAGADGMPRLSSPPQPFPVSQFTNATSLLRSIHLNGKPAAFDFDGSKTTSVAGNMYWTIPVTGTGRVGRYVRYVILKASGSSLRLLKIVPTSDTPTKYSYGNNLRGDEFEVSRPYDRPGTKCCKFDKNFEYRIIGDSVRLVRIYFSPELP